jgi:hypothetical protein
LRLATITGVKMMFNTCVIYISFSHLLFRHASTTSRTPNRQSKGGKAVRSLVNSFQFIFVFTSAYVQKYVSVAGVMHRIVRHVLSEGAKRLANAKAKAKAKAKGKTSPASTEPDTPEDEEELQEEEEEEEEWPTEEWPNLDEMEEDFNNVG